ncbi:HHE domain-containing protein [Xylariaceae sp. FL0255]|nr:HHE domain-containing protein [Xylariaceae sp. FL0255]
MAYAVSTISATIATDHRELEQCCNKRYGIQFTWTLSRQSFSKGLVVYSGFEKCLGPKVPNMMSSDQVEYVAKLKEFWSNPSYQIKDEEIKDLSALEDAPSTTEAFVPSRSHPTAREQPPFETAMASLTAPIDHLTDLFRKFPDKTTSPNPYN